MTQNNVTTTYEYDANNRLLKETVASSVTTYTYDANGNLINAWKAGNPVGAYAYNLFGNQVSFTADGVLYTYYTYRPDGLRHSIGDKIHVWDAANIVADVDDGDITVYVRGINLIYADDGDKTYYHFNAHGDVVVLTNESGTKTKSYSYNAFGMEYNEATLDDNPFRYCGEYYDKETKTIYLRARYYNAEQGRFTQEDTHWNVSNMLEDYASIIQSGNLYVYCGNNPVVRKDGIGCFWDTVFDVVSLAMSVVDVATNPTNPWAWAGMIGDIADLIPFVSGVGEVTKALGAAKKAGEVLTEVKDTQKAIKNVTELAKETGEVLSEVKDTQKAIENMAGLAEAGGDGYKTFKTAKKNLNTTIDADVDKNIEWHHLVEQSQIKRNGFDKTSINNSSNLVGIDSDLHHKISGFYSSKPVFLKNPKEYKTVRDWVTTLDYQQQYTFGVFALQRAKYMK